MPFAVELRLNQAAENEFLDLWKLLQTQGISDLLPRLNYRPHITLGMYDNIDVAKSIAILDHLLPRLTPLPAEFRHLTIFNSSSASLVTVPFDAVALKKMHRLFDRRFGQVNREFYRPGNWVPHVTVGMELAPPNLMAAIACIAPAWKPITGIYNRVALVRFRPGVVLWQKRLTQ